MRKSVFGTFSPILGQEGHDGVIKENISALIENIKFEEYCSKIPK